MIDHGQEEKIITGYNPGIVKRILRYAGPFRGYLAVAMMCLIVATVGEMLIPVLIQRTIDHEILDSWVIAGDETLELLSRPGEIRMVGTTRYLREHVLDELPRPVRTELRERGVLDTRRYRVIRSEILEQHPQLEDRVLQSIREAADIDSGWIAIEDSVLERLTPDERRILRQDNISGLQRNVILFLIVLGAVLLGGFGQVYLTAYTGQLVMKTLRLDLFDHTVHQNLGYLGNQPVGRLVTRVTNDVETINELFTSVMAELTRNVSLMIAVIITMFSLNSRLAGIVLISMLPVVIITNVVRKRAREAFRRVRRAVSSVNTYLSEYISGMAIVQMFGQQNHSRSEFQDRNDTLMHANLSEMYVFAIFRPLVDLMASISTAVIIFAGALLLQIDLVSLGVLIAFTNLIRRFYMPVMSISEQFTVLQSAMAGSERVFEILDQDRRLPDTGTVALTPGEVQGAIEFQDVRFSYKSDEPVLKGLSFSATPGEMVAVVGYTGSGKTTIINLLTRLWDVDEGRIQLDGHDIRSIPLGNLRRAVQQIQQDVFLFDDTIRNNITLGMKITDEAVLAACEAVQIGPFIQQLPQGLDTHLAEGGANLSAGQRQLVAFARVLVHDPPVLVLDEATSSIDSETEQKLQHAVDIVTAGRTSLVVAHRLSTIQHADRILVLSQGELVETGTHRELLRQNGLYATLYHFQYQQQTSRTSPPDNPRD